MSTLRKYKVQVFGAGIVSLDAQKEFAKAFEFNFPLLADPGKETAKAYGVYDPILGQVERWAFVIDEKGIVRAIDRHVNPMEHGKDVAKTLADLKIPRR